MTLTIDIKMGTPSLGIKAQEFAENLVKSRGLCPKNLLETGGLGSLSPPFSLKNIDRACIRLQEAMIRQEVIGILSDHDCDGQTACAVLYSVLTEVFSYPSSHIVCFIGHRTEEGYGITEKLTERILAHNILPHVIITADCGSSDQKNIAILNNNGIDIIVTDHHQIPQDGPPKAAYAVINPQQEGCDFPDKNVAGCAVAWLVMCALRACVLESLPSKSLDSKPSLPSMTPYLDFVAIGTLSDCVSLTKSVNNRIFLKYGLQRIRQGSRPCWRVLKRVYPENIDCAFLIFKVIPLINADGRLSNALGGVGFLIGADMVSAQEQLAILMETNEHRKHLQKMQLVRARALIEEGVCAQVLNLSTQGHHGIHGVTASRIAEEQKKMTIIFSQIESEENDPILAGSARGPEGECLKTLLDCVAKTDPSLILRYGGHSQAAGISLYARNFELFKKQFIAHYEGLYGSNSSKAPASVECDVILPSSLLRNTAWIWEVEALMEPFGKGFPKPTIGVWGSIVEGRVMGSEKNHLQLSLQIEGALFKTMVFFCPEAKAFLGSMREGIKLWIGELSFETYKQSRQYIMILKGVYDPEKKTWSSAQTLNIPAQCPKAASLLETLNFKDSQACVQGL